jgi:hypothetical protein
MSHLLTLFLLKFHALFVPKGMILLQILIPMGNNIHMVCIY